MNKIVVGSSFLILLAAMAAFGQPKPITQKEYEDALQHAADMGISYPMIEKIEEEKFRDSRQIEKATFSTEYVSEDKVRATMQIVSGGKTTNLSEIGLGIGKIYCKVGDGKWKLESESKSAECHDAWNLIPTPSRSGPEDGVTYTSEDQTVGGQRVTAFRKYVVYGGKQTFLEQITTVDSKGFITIATATQGTLDPRTVTVTVKVSWTSNAKIAPIIKPKE